MNSPKTISDIKVLIDQEIEENLNLEYKSADALQNTDGKKKEIAKDVSAMANSAGGVIIYGIKEFNEDEKRHLPEKVTPIKRTDFSKEQLEHIIQSNIFPKIDSLLIHPISLEKSDEVIYVVEIPQSTTAHQNLKDFRYYKRYNFEAVPMYDYEIKDIMNRNKHPIVKLEFKIVDSRMSFTFGGPRYFLNMKLRNIGSVLANYVNYFVQLPTEIISDGNLKNMRVTSNKAEYYGDNTYRDRIEVDKNIENYNVYEGPSRYDPILPGLTGGHGEFSLKKDILLDEKEITWTVHADNAPPIKGKIKLIDIPVK